MAKTKMDRAEREARRMVDYFVRHPTMTIEQCKLYYARALRAAERRGEINAMTLWTQNPEKSITKP